jgi:hypothetical protein
MASRSDNERKFPNWEDLANGGRRYWREVVGRRGWRARYVKIVDASENTISFVQEIYNSVGELVQIHEKFPEDKGHRQA